MIAEQYAFFPALNATLNGTSAALLLTGRVLIAKGRIAAHRACMIAAVTASGLFLGCYLFFHFKVGNILFLVFHAVPTVPASLIRSAGILPAVLWVSRPRFE